MRNLASVDLNLLVAFEALLIERNVSRAADRIGLAQSSMSGVLARLRALFDDELFVRTSREMKPTARALELAQPIGEALRHARRALDQGLTFDPAATQRRFVVGATYYANFTMLPRFVRMLRSEAPAVRIYVRTIDFADTVQMLDEGRVDLAVGVLAHLPKRISVRSIVSDRFVCIARRGHAALTGGLTLDAFVALDHASWSLAGDPVEAVDKALEQIGHIRRIVFVVQNFFAISVVVANSDLLAIVPERVARELTTRYNIDCWEIPLELPTQMLGVAWSRHRSGDPGVSWLRDRASELLSADAAH